MAVKVNADNVIALLIEHQTFFFKQLDEMEKYNGFLPLNYYQQLFYQELENISDHKERQRWKNAMNPKNLDYAGLLLQLDSYQGYMKWQGFVVELFRHFDRSRLRPLSDPHLQEFCQRLQDRLQALMALEPLPQNSEPQNHPQWVQTIHTVFETLEHIQARIRENTANLQNRAEHLAEILEPKDPGDLSQYSTKALEEVRSLYELIILPTLSFLNEHEYRHQQQAPLHIISQMAQFFEDQQLPLIARRIWNIKNSIRSFNKDIEKIRQNMQRYVKQSEQERQKYNAIESLFNQLREETEKRQDGKLRGNKLSYELIAKQAFPHFLHLKNHVSENHVYLNWQGEQQKLLYAEHLRLYATRLEQERNKSPAQVPITIENQHLAQQKRQHQEKLQLAIQGFQPNRTNSEDLQSQLHQYLSHQLTDYSLPDLIDAITWLKILHKLRLRAFFGLKVLCYGNYQLNYHPLYLEQSE